MSVPLKANQVRTRINRKMIRTYYIVAEDQAHGFHCMWFRTDPEQAMMLINGDAPYKPSKDDIVVLDNINLLTDTFAEIIGEARQGVTEEVAEPVVVIDESKPGADKMVTPETIESVTSMMRGILPEPSVLDAILKEWKDTVYAEMEKTELAKETKVTIAEDEPPF